MVRVEVNHVFRGTMLPVQTRSLTAESRRLFTAEVQAPVLATAEPYAGKLVAALTSDHRAFLLGLVQGGRWWELMQCERLAELPAIRWKLQNLAKLKRSSPDKHAQQADRREHDE